MQLMADTVNVLFNTLCNSLANFVTILSNAWFGITKTLNVSLSGDSVHTFIMLLPNGSIKYCHPSVIGRPTCVLYGLVTSVFSPENRAKFAASKNILHDSATGCVIWKSRDRRWSLHGHYGHLTPVVACHSGLSRFSSSERKK